MCYLYLIIGFIQINTCFSGYDWFKKNSGITRIESPDEHLDTLGLSRVKSIDDALPKVEPTSSLGQFFDQQNSFATQNIHSRNVPEIKITNTPLKKDILFDIMKYGPLPASPFTRAGINKQKSNLSKQNSLLWTTFRR